MIKKFINDIYIIRWGLFIFLVYSTVFQIFFDTICPFRAITNIPCPGCGLTHACIYFFCGNISLAFKTNPNFISWLVCIVILGVDRYIYKFKCNLFVPILFCISSFINVIWYILFYIF